MYGQNHSFDCSCRHDVILGQASFSYNIKLAFSTSQHCPETPREMECYVAGSFISVNPSVPFLWRAPMLRLYFSFYYTIVLK